MAIADLYTANSARMDSMRKAAGLAVSRIGGGGGSVPYPVEPSAANAFDTQDLQNASRQYKALRDHQYTAIRPVAVKIADLPIRAGTKKAARPAGKPKQTKAYQLAPEFIRKEMAEGLDTLESHDFLELMEAPNSIMSGWSMLYCTAMSIEATGKSYWLVEPAPGSNVPLRLWYMPSHWVKPVHREGRPFAGFRIQPPGVAESDAKIVPYESMIYFAYPDPSDPLSTLSPMQTQARAINTDSEIQKAQHALVANGIRPGAIITMGRMDPGASGIPAGSMPRPTLTPEQRMQIVQAARLLASGPTHYGEPWIIDGFIESVTPWTLTAPDLDFPAGSDLTRNRIFSGIGTPEIVAGLTQNANKATSYTAQEIFYANKVNPLGRLISEALTKWLAPRYVESGGRLYFWLEKAEAFDADLQLAQAETLISGEAITKDELREMFDMPPLEKGGDEIAAPKKPEPMPPSAKPQSAGRTASQPAKAKRLRRPPDAA